MIDNNFLFSANLLIPLFLTVIIFFIDNHSENKTANTIKVATLSTATCLFLSIILLISSFGQVANTISIDFLNKNINLRFSPLSLSFMTTVNFILLLALCAIRNQKISFPKESIGLILLEETVINTAISVTDIMAFYILFAISFFLQFMVIIIRNRHQQKLNLHRTLIIHLFFITTAIAAVIYIKTQYLTTQTDVLCDINFSKTENNILFWLLSMPLLAAMAIFPFHSWLTTVSSLLTNTYRLLLTLNIVVSTFAFLKHLNPIFLHNIQEHAIIMQSIGIISLIFASSCMIYGNNLLKKLNYLTIALSSYIYIAIFSNIKSPEYTVMLLIGASFEITIFSEMVSVIKNRLKTLRLSTLSGLKNIIPELNFFFILLMLSLANIPLSISFIGKFMTLQTILNNNPLLVIAIIFGHIFIAASAISLYRQMFIGTPPSNQTLIKLEKHEILIFSLSTAIIYIFGIFPYLLLNKIGN